MTKIELIGNMVALRQEIRIALYKLAHEHGSALEQFMTCDKLPTYVWVNYKQFAVLHEEYVALKQGILVLA